MSEELGAVVTIRNNTWDLLKCVACSATQTCREADLTLVETLFFEMD